MRGAALVILGAMLWGTTGTAQALAPPSATPLGVGAARMVFGGAALLIVALARHRLRGLSRLPLPLTLLSIASMAAYQPFFFAGVARTGVAVGSVVTVGSSPILAGVLAYLFLREIPTRRWYVATLMAVAGCVLLMLPQQDLSSVDPAGVVLALTAGLSYSTFVLAGKQLSRYCTVDVLNAVVFSGAGLLLLPVFFIEPPRWLLDPRGAAAALHLGLLATALAYLLFVRGLILVPASTGVTLSLAEPMTASVLGFVFLDERLEPLGLLGLGLLLSAVILLSVRRKVP